MLSQSPDQDYKSYKTKSFVKASSVFSTPLLFSLIFSKSIRKSTDCLHLVKNSSSGLLICRTECVELFQQHKEVKKNLRRWVMCAS